eukprot:TRINITY_DN8247_c0_g1_i5.p1 TRINITY_DN8247_c0_g1~~TRINITY_DN8247_c0_g1_i5.p1  ORF type:complete len:168 (-),score=27.14 TRINITY_DN8247_c0_g1_i5:70-573(-)
MGRCSPIVDRIGHLELIPPEKLVARRVGRKQVPAEWAGSGLGEPASDTILVKAMPAWQPRCLTIEGLLANRAALELPRCHLDGELLERMGLHPVQQCLPRSSTDECGRDPRSPGSSGVAHRMGPIVAVLDHLSLIHISEPTRLLSISYAVFCLKKKKKKSQETSTAY